MESRDFRGFYNLKEVQCSGGSVNSNLRLHSLKLMELGSSKPVILAILQTDTKTCLTFSEYSSCQLDHGSSRKSKLSVLVHDLKDGESRKYGCTAHTSDSLGDPVLTNWEIVVTVKCKYFRRVTQIT